MRSCDSDSMISYGVMPVSRCGTCMTSISMPAPPRDAHLAGRAGQPGRAHVLHADERVGLHQLEARLEQQLLHERIADLHRRALLGRLLVELRRRHRRAMDAVAAGLRADVIHRVADAGGAALDQRVGACDAEAEHVDERIAGVPVVERDLAADRRNADAVAVAGDAGDDAFDDAPRARAVGTVQRRRSAASSSARSGRAPIVKMSRMMPPTPVAAPWYGSMNDG